jgi:hypothetical protein
VVSRLAASQEGLSSVNEGVNYCGKFSWSVAIAIAVAITDNVHHVHEFNEDFVTSVRGKDKETLSVFSSEII